MSKKTSNTTTAPPNDTINDDTLPRDETTESLDLSDLDLGSIQLSEREMKTLSCLTPALSRRLQKQLLAHLPPAAARTLRRTLSMHNPHLAERPHYTRSHSASKSADPDPSSAGSDVTDRSDISALNLDKSERFTTGVRQKASWNPDPRSPLPTIEDVQPKDDTLQNIDNMSGSRFSTLPRPKRRSSRNSDNISVDSGKITDNLSDYSVTTSGPSLRESMTPLRTGSIRSTPDRSVLSKYFTPERTTPTEESYCMLSPEPPTSLLSEPSYIAAYGTPAGSGIPLTGSLRKRSLRLPTDSSPRRRVSRFLRPDFFDTPREESVYAREKKDREMETQKVLKEIREKRNHSSDRGCISPRSPLSPLGVNESKLFMDVNERHSYMNTLSATGGLLQRDRSRSITPFSPILDNINEASYDLNYNRNNINTTNSTVTDQPLLKNNLPVHNGNTVDHINNNENKIDNNNTIINYESGAPEAVQSKSSSPTKNSRLARPKSFPNKNTEPLFLVDVKNDSVEITDVKAKKEDSRTQTSVCRESKIMRPKSYPATTPSPEKSFPRPNPQSDIATADFTSDLVVGKNVCTENNDDKQKKDDNGNITVTFNVNLPAKTNRLNSTPAPEVVCDDVAEKTEKKKIIKKKVVKKKIVTQKSTENGGEASAADITKAPEKKKIIRKKEEANSSETTSTKKVTVKKKSVLQSLGQKFEKLRGDTVSKSNSPDKEKVDTQTNSVAPIIDESKNENETTQVKEKSSPTVKLPEPTTESGLITRAITENSLDSNDTSNSNKKSVSRVLGLFKKFESKEKGTVKSKSKSPEERKDGDTQETSKSEDKPPVSVNQSDKPKRPTSLLLNGFGRKSQSRYAGAASDSALNNTLETETKSLPNGNIKQAEGDDVKPLKKNLKLDVSKLPRINQNLFPKKDSIDDSKIRDDNPSKELAQAQQDCNADEVPDSSSKDDKLGNDNSRDGRHELSHSSEVSPSMEEVNWSPDYDSSKFVGRVEVPTQSTDHTSHHPHRNHEPMTPDHEDVEERIRRKSFYSRFNEKKQRRKSSLVGPGAKEYDPALRIQIPTTMESSTKYEASPSSPMKYDISPSFNVDRLKALQSDLISPTSTKHLTSNLDNYRSFDRSDIYRSLDRSDIRKSPQHKYTSLETTPTYSIPRYNRTVSLFDDGDSAKGSRPLDSKLNKTFSMYSPGNYATYSPRGRTRNSAIILKEEKELSPENVLVRIRERKKAAMEAKESKDLNLDSQTRSNDAYKSKSDSSECTEKTN